MSDWGFGFLAAEAGLGVLLLLGHVLYYRVKNKRQAKERAQSLADLRADLARQADANRIRRLAEWDARTREIDQRRGA